MDISIPPPGKIDIQSATEAPYNYLKKFHLLSSLSEKQLERVHQHSSSIKLKEGQSLFMQGDLSLRLRALVDEITTLSLQTGSCRVASYLLENAPENEDTFKLEIAKGVIAARLSIKPETFSRIL